MPRPASAKRNVCGPRRHDHVATECEFEATAHPPTLPRAPTSFALPDLPFLMIRPPRS